MTRVDVPQEMRNVRLAIGANAASIWWLNDEEVIGIYGDRQTVIDDGVSKRLTLTKGLNTIRVAVINAGGATDFCARFLDADDAPVRGIRVRLGPEPSRLSTQEKLPSLGFRIVDGATRRVEHHRRAPVGSERRPRKPGWLGLPVRAKLAQAVAIFFASACASGPLPVPCAQRLVLSKQKASSAVCQAPASSSIGDCQVKYHGEDGRALLRRASSWPCA